MNIDCAVYADAAPAGTGTWHRFGGSSERLVLHPVVRLPMAIPAQGFSAAVDGTGLFLSTARRRLVGTDQPLSADGGARGAALITFRLAGRWLC